ncbi:hypothetical protein [Streptomyces varsoviensis]|uniref:hypothetical protein n=1 Tax=Streptomyces varsoviensis TaxID=67373 RepID=UPI0009986F28|nr:hypothetical protein [Streptomyces varsoviensis]
MSEPIPHAHTTTTTENGSFCIARCACGWYGPARRARARAREDAAAHLVATGDGTAHPGRPSV